MIHSGQLSETEKQLAEIMAVQTIRIKQLEKAISIFEKAHITQRNFTEEESEFIDEIRETIEN